MIFSIPISNYILRDNRTFYSILILAPSLPFMSISCCIKGYFYAMRKSLHPSNAIVIEQIIKMIFTIGLISLNLNKNDAYSCAIVSFGMTIGEIASCIRLCLAMGILTVCYLDGQVCKWCCCVDIHYLSTIQHYVIQVTVTTNKECCQSKNTCGYNAKPSESCFHCCLELDLYACAISIRWLRIFVQRNNRRRKRYICRKMFVCNIPSMYHISYMNRCSHTEA